MRFFLKIRYNLLSFVACIIEKKVVFREKGQNITPFLLVFIYHFKTLSYELQCINSCKFSNNISI